ncbi:hypothetical protein Aperf_G00000042995 [Anoplocephala perfoliata]
MTEDDNDDFEQRMKQELQSEIISYSSRNTKPTKDEGLSEPHCADDLLYDPEEDMVNEKFARHLQKVSQNGEVGDATTDAILNCPGCMSLLSLNCQRHSKYKTQYRTMFTFNCKVVEDGSKGQLAIDPPEEATPADMVGLKQVACEICNTPVGVQESNGVYHLFNVLASHS